MVALGGVAAATLVSSCCLVAEEGGDLAADLLSARSHAHSSSHAPHHTHTHTHTRPHPRATHVLAPITTAGAATALARAAAAALRTDGGEKGERFRAAALVLSDEEGEEERAAVQRLDAEVENKEGEGGGEGKGDEGKGDEGEGSRGEEEEAEGPESWRNAGHGLDDETEFSSHGFCRRLGAVRRMRWPQRGTNTSLQRLLRNMCEPEQLDGDNEWYCRCVGVEGRRERRWWRR